MPQSGWDLRGIGACDPRTEPGIEFAPTERAAIRTVPIGTVFVIEHVEDFSRR